MRRRAGRTACSALNWSAAALAAVLSGAAVLGTATPASALGPAAPDDPLFNMQWDLTKVGAPAAWTASTGRGVPIGIVDTGVDPNQEDVAGKILASTDCVGSQGQEVACTGTGDDDNGHGTQVAGIAAAITNNSRGVAGMAPDSTLVVAKVLDSSGGGNFNDVNAGIEWVVDHGARVVNLSLGSDMPALSGILGNSLSAGVQYAWSHGAIAVLAAGNQNFFGLGSYNYGNANAVVVGATGPNDEVAPYSSPLGNAKWALVAPGGDGQDSSGKPSCGGSAQTRCIVSTWWQAANSTDAYAFDEGTSMATPLVSGALALLLARGLSPSAAVQALLRGADHAVSCGSNCAGRLDAARAVGAAKASNPSSPPATNATPTTASPVSGTTTPAQTAQAPPTTVAGTGGVGRGGPGGKSVVASGSAGGTPSADHMRPRPAGQEPSSVPWEAAPAAAAAFGLAGWGWAAYRRRKTVTTLP